MQVSVEKTGPCRAKISMTVGSDEFEAKVKSLLAAAGRNIKMKGFRPGKVPPEIVERQRGRAVRQETRQHFLQEAWERATKEGELNPLAHPRVELPEGDQLAGTDFSLDFEVDLRPDVELGEYKQLEIESKIAPVGDQDVEQAIEHLVQQNSRPEPAGEDGLAADGMALCKVVLIHEGQEVFSRDGLRLAPKLPFPGVDAEAFEQAMSGATDGAEFELPISFPENFEQEQLRGQAGTGRVTVDKAFRIVPPEREQLYDLLEVKTEEELSAKVREKLEEAAVSQENARIESTLIGRIIEAHDIDLPETMLAEQIKTRLAQAASELEAQGVAPEEIPGPTPEQELAARQGAVHATKGYFLIEAIAQKEGLKVTEEELLAELREIAVRNQASLEEVRDYYQEQNLFGQLAMEVVERKVRTFLRESAQISRPG
jgi:trigger factor